MKKKLTIILSFIIILIVVLGVLFNNKQKDSSLTKVRVAEVAHSIFYAPQYVALHKDFFKDEGLDVEISLAAGADKVTAAVLSGDVEIGFSGSEATIYVYNGGEKDFLKNFAQLTQKDGSFIVSREKIDNFKLSDLKGKYYIAGRIGGMPEMTLEYILSKNGINPKSDVTLDTSVAFSAMQGAFISGTGDFVSLFEPSATKVEQEGYGYIVASLGELGGNVPYTAYNARISYIENNPDIIDKFTKAIEKGLDYVHNHTSKEIAEVIKDEFPDTNISDLATVIERYKSVDTWPTTTDFTEESFNHLQDIMINANELTEKVNYNDLVYTK
ncbi:MAG: ABC transporter substrate-binding protein [Bacilli bacterium]|nr:ABC transporter substrate-binding protein [Bacilli bacterium]